MDKLCLSEKELAQRWGIAQKTLQRWRTEGRGPRYLKLSKRVVYQVEEVKAFEYSMAYESTSQKVEEPPPPPTLPTEPAWLTSRQLASVTGIPLYLLANPSMRAKLKIPHSRIGSLIRFNTKEVIVWAHEVTEQSMREGAEATDTEEAPSLLKTLSALKATEN